MKQFVETILKTDLNPNQYILLYCLVNGLNINLNFNPTIERKALKSKGYLTDKGELTNKAGIINNQDPLDPFYHANYELEDRELTITSRKLNQLYPLILPSGIYGRSPSVKLIKDRLRAFMRLYEEYTFETIFEATNNYVKRCQSGNFRYMKPLHNFILKDDEESTLALECEIIKSDRKEFGKVI